MSLARARARQRRGRFRDRAQHGSDKFSGCSANALAIVFTERGNRQCLRLEVVDDNHVLDAETFKHRVRTDDPVAIGQRNFIAVDRTGNGENSRTRAHVRLCKNALQDRFIDGSEIGCANVREIDGLGRGVRKNGEARIRSADIANQDRKRQVGIAGVEHGHSRFRV
ncbi:hypothetical protein AJ87_02295 [Rhizobium yanglingense]|nr:hypothetical protein AJ87_02295 [Rhizobium yanglingense]